MIDEGTNSVHDFLVRSFHLLENVQQQAEKQCGVRERHLELGGRVVHLRTAGEALSNALLPALSHLPAVEDRDMVDLEIRAWDESESGIPAPAFPWQWARIEGTVRLVLPAGGEAFRIHAYEDGVMFFIYSLEARRAIFWTRDVRLVPTFFRAAPFLMLMHWWARESGLQLVHAGCVGTEQGVALIAGKGGSGKSTTSLLCTLAGMDYLSDDFCLVQAKPQREVISLYSSGKLHREHFARLPALAALALDPVPDAFDKPLIFMRDHFPQQVKPRAALRAVIVPQVAGTEHTHWEPLPVSVALRALTSSTMFQFSPDDGTAFRTMADVLRGLRCYRLYLGTQLEEIPVAVRAIIAEATKDSPAAV